MLNGAMAGGFSAFVTTPIDVSKTRIMTDAGKGVYKTFWQTIGLIVKNEGILALWGGWHVRVLFTTVGGTVFFGTFEGVMKIMQKEY